MSPADLDALLARLDRRVQTERPNAARDAQDAAAAVRAARAERESLARDLAASFAEVERLRAEAAYANRMWERCLDDLKEARARAECALCGKPADLSHDDGESPLFCSADCAGHFGEGFRHADDHAALLARLDDCHGPELADPYECRAVIREAAAAIRALRARLDDWENDPRTKAMEVEIQGAMADVTRLNRVLDETPHGIAIRENAKLRREAKERSDEYQGLNAFWKQAMDNQVARAERAEAEVERLRADNERGAWIDEARANLVRAERAEAALARARGLLP